MFFSLRFKYIQNVFVLFTIVGLMSLYVSVPAREVHAQETPPPVCEPNAPQTIVSDTSTLKGTVSSVPVSQPYNSRWTVSIPGATWIWGEDPISNTVDTTSETFTRGFTIVGTSLGATLTIAADNSYTTSVNGHHIGDDPTEFNYQSSADDGSTNPDSYTIPEEDLVTGPNTITFTVTNLQMAGGTPATNPAGLLYKLVVNSCEEPKLQCNDGVDNSDPEDSLADANDPGCHTDGTVTNSGSFDPNDNDETDVVVEAQAPSSTEVVSGNRNRTNGGGSGGGGGGGGGGRVLGSSTETTIANPDSVIIPSTSEETTKKIPAPTPSLQNIPVEGEILGEEDETIAPLFDVSSEPIPSSGSIPIYGILFLILLLLLLILLLLYIIRRIRVYMEERAKAQEEMNANKIPGV